MIVTGSTLDDSEKAIALCRSHPGRLRATAGVHPHHATSLADADAGRLEALMGDPMVVAAGECGLDYFRNCSPPAEQRRAFELQLGIAERHTLPVFLHQRDAHADFVSMLRAHPQLLTRAVLHCFTGGPAELEDCLALGLSVGITGWICDERRGQALREAAPRVPGWCSKPMRRISCRARSSQNHRIAAMSLRTCRMYSARRRTAAEKMNPRSQKSRPRMPVDSLALHWRRDPTALPRKWFRYIQ